MSTITSPQCGDLGNFGGFRAGLTLQSNLGHMFSYLDAGTGSMLVSILGSGLAGIGVLWKMARGKVTGKSATNLEDASADAEDSDSAHD